MTDCCRYRERRDVPFDSNTFPSPLIDCCRYRERRDFPLDSNIFPSPLIDCCRYRERRDFPLDSNIFPSPLIDCCRYRERRDFPFDNMFWALLTLFEVLTLEGWLDVRDMLKSDGGWPDSATAWVCTCTHMYIGAGYCMWINMRVAVFSPGFFNRRARADHQVSSPIKRACACCSVPTPQCSVAISSLHL